VYPRSRSPKVTTELVMPKEQKTARKPGTKAKPYVRTMQDNPSASSNDLVETPSACPVCDQTIKEPSEDGNDPGDDALFCEGKCKAWYHWKCVGLSKCAYKQASESNDPFYCMFCLQTHYNNVIAGLKEQIKTLVAKLDQSSASAEVNP